MTKDDAIEYIIEDCLAILRAKGNDYQDDISPLGIRGCFANLFRKIMRLKSLIWDGKEAFLMKLCWPSADCKPKRKTC